MQLKWNPRNMFFSFCMDKLIPKFIWKNKKARTSVGRGQRLDWLYVKLTINHQQLREVFIGTAIGSRCRPLSLWGWWELWQPEQWCWKNKVACAFNPFPPKCMFRLTPHCVLLKMHSCFRTGSKLAQAPVQAPKHQVTSRTARNTFLLFIQSYVSCEQHKHTKQIF